MSSVLQQVVNALSTSAIYILVALGITQAFGMSRIVNFAHGQFLVLGSFLGFSLVEAGVSFWAALVIAPCIVGLVAVVLEATLLRRTIDDPMAGFIATLGLAIALTALYTKIWGSQIHRIPSDVTGAWVLGGVRIARDRALIVAVTVVALLAMFLLLRATSVGRSMRSVAENREAAALLGVPVGRTISISFFVGSFLAGLGGVLLGAVFPFTAFTGQLLLIKAVAIAVVGGLGSVSGAIVVGLALGLVETFAVGYGLPLGFTTLGAEWRDGYAFVLLMVMLVWRPTGLFRGVSETRTRQ